MTPPIIRPRDKRSTAAAKKFVQEAALDLCAAAQARTEAMRWLAHGSVDPLKALDALAAYRAGEDAVNAALAKYCASLRLAGVSAHAIARASRTRTATIASRIDAVPAARQIRYARGADIALRDGSYVIGPRPLRSTVQEEL